jgi:hypothetical protein
VSKGYLLNTELFDYLASVGVVKTRCATVSAYRQTTLACLNSQLCAC